MKTESSVRPSEIEVTSYKKGIANVKLRKDITEKTVEDEDGDTNTIYEYEETEIRMANRENLKDYIEDNFDKLFKQGIEEEDKREELKKKQKKVEKLVDEEYNLADLKETVDQLVKDSLS